MGLDDSRRGRRLHELHKWRHVHRVVDFVLSVLREFLAVVDHLDVVSRDGPVDLERVAPGVDEADNFQQPVSSWHAECGSN